MRLASQLRLYLEIQDISLSELARRASVPKQSISGWLHGKNPRSIPQLKKVAIALGVGIDELCFGALVASDASTPGSLLPSPSQAPYGHTATLNPPDDELFAILSFAGFYNEVTPAWEALFGWSLPELRSRPAIEFVHRGDRLRCRARLLGLSQDPRMRVVDFRHHCKDGGIRWFRLHCLPFPRAGLVSCVGRDLGMEYPPEADLTCKISLSHLLAEALEIVKTARAWQGVEFVVPEPRSEVQVHCKLAQMSMVVLAMVHSATMVAAASSTRRPVACYLRGEEKFAKLEIDAPPYAGDLNLSTLAGILHTHHGDLQIVRAEHKTKFDLTLPVGASPLIPRVFN